jgi:uncharacterized heparinase superfamily protein
MNHARPATGGGRTGALARIGQRLAFARHVPPRRIARRLSLDVKRRVLVKVARRELAEIGPLARAETPPQAVMAPRSGRIRHAGDGLELTFLNRSRALAFPIPWRIASGDRRDQLWSMSLHYMEYLEEADDATFVRLVEDWLGHNPPYRPDYWRDAWNSYALSLRVVVWMQQIARRPDLPALLQQRMQRSIAGQLGFLERNLETDLGGNHLVKNVKALVWGSAFFAGPEAERWRSLGLGLLDEVLREQVLADGVHEERSASYHAQVFVDLMECRAALGRDPLGDCLDRALASMAYVTANLAHGDGGPVLFNDSGLSMSYPPAQCLEAYRQLTGVAVGPQPVFAYPSAGYFGRRSGGDSFIADCGPIAPDALPAHGHGDVLSFEWSVEGRRIIVDQGVYEYVAGPRRAAARSAASHNTVAIEGSDQAEFFGDFRVGRRPRATIGQWWARADGFVLEGFHDGFVQLSGGPVHTRTFDVSHDRILIVDRLSGRAEGAVRQGLLLHPDVKATCEGRSVRLASGTVEIEIVSEVELAVEPAVWWPNLGVELATSRLVAAWPAGCERASLEFRVIRRG